MPIAVDKLANAGQFIPNLRAVAEDYARGGQPEPEGLQLLKEAGIRTIINLRSSESGLVSFFRRSATGQAVDPELEREKRIVKELGMRFVQIPLDIFADPDEAHFSEFLLLVAEPETNPTFVHCLHGRDRTGLMTAIYRVALHNWAPEKAYAEMIECGFDASRTNLSDAFFAYAKKQNAR